MSTKPVVVIGDGWAALGAVGYLITSGIEVTWIGGSATRILPPLASLEVGPGVQRWQTLAERLGIEIGESRHGALVKEFRNKSFREPAWVKSPTPETRKEVRDELLWTPEQRIVGVFEARFEISLGEIEDEFRKILNQDHFPKLKKIENSPVTALTKDGDQVSGVQLGNGEWIECSQLIYADRWGLLTSLEGMPKPVTLLRKKEPMGALQAVLTHSIPLGVGITNSFFASMPKNPGEKLERHLWGHFSSDGKRSVWTICLSPEEVENNHEIGKKLRKLKNTLDKIFEGSGIFPPEHEVFAASGGFAKTIQDEQVRFVEELLFSEGIAPDKPISVNGLQGASFLTDGYGPSSSLHQVGLQVELMVGKISSSDVELGGPHAETESVHSVHAPL